MLKRLAPLLLASAASAAPAGVPAPLMAAGAAAEQPGASRILVRQNTPIRLMVLNEVSTRTAKPGDRFVLRVDEPVVVNDVTVVPVGAKAWGEVLSAEKSGHIGKSGKLSARLLSLELGGRQIPISGENKTAGESGTTQVALGALGMGPLALLARGNNARLKAGEMFSAYFEADMLYDPRTSSLSPLEAASATR